MIFDDEEPAVYVISVVASLTGMHPQTLRMYERRGLVVPKRSPGGNRRYREMDVARLRRIQELTNEGLNLTGVQRVLELEAEVERLEDEVLRLASERAELNKRYRREIVPLASTILPFPTHRPRG